MLKETILKLFKLDGLVDNLTGYVESRIELMKYEVKEDMARAASKIFLLLLSALFFTFFVLFASVAVAHKIGESVGAVMGFTIVAGFYFAVLLVTVIFRKPIGKNLEKKVKNIITNTSDENGNG
jgi:hypothetical protein